MPGHGAVDDKQTLRGLVCESLTPARRTHCPAGATPPCPAQHLPELACVAHCVCGPVIREARGRSPDPVTDGAARPQRRSLLNGAVAPLSPNDRASCNQARPAADITVPKLLQPKRVWPADRRNARGLACPEPSRSRDRSPANQDRLPFHACPDQPRSSIRCAAGRSCAPDPHRNAQTATRLVDEVVKSGYPLIARARARRGRHGRRGDWSQRRP